MEYGMKTKIIGASNSLLAGRLGGPWGSGFGPQEQSDCVIRDIHTKPGCNPTINHFSKFINSHSYARDELPLNPIVLCACCMSEHLSLVGALK